MTTSCIIPVLQLVDGTMKINPYLIVEVKCSVGACPSVINEQHMVQVALQAYYALIKYEKKDIVVSLTDGIVWHMALFETATSTQLVPVTAVKWWDTKMIGKSLSTIMAWGQSSLNTLLERERLSNSSHS